MNLVLRLRGQLFLEELLLALEQELVYVKADMVITVQILRVLVWELDTAFRKLGELVDNQPHLKTTITCERFVGVRLNQI